MFAKKRGREFDYSEYYQDDEEDLDPSPRSRRRLKSRAAARLWPHLLGLGMIGLTFLVAVAVFAGVPMAEKTVQALIAPLGVIWIGLFLTFYLSGLARARAPAVVSLALWLLLTASGNSFVASWLISSLESPFHDSTIKALPELDVVLVLGGGVGTTPDHRAQLGSAGDRVMQAALLYHAGKTKTIVCAGTHGLPPAAAELTQAEAAAQLLRQLKIPLAAILQVEGRNTREELQAFDRWLESQEQSDLQIGILTSAWHLPRALRLAESIGIDATPVPADFNDRPFRREPGILIPTADNLLRTQRALKEYLAGLVSR